MSSLHRVIARGRQSAWLPTRSLSSMAMKLSDTNTNGAVLRGFLLPHVHSRKQLAPACTDVAELQDLTEHVLTTETGNLFQFNRGSQQQDRQDRDAAWDQADGTVQMVEYLMRGHSAQIPGTLWHGWTREHRWTRDAVSAQDPLKNLEVMVELLDRLHQEGDFYMKTRKEHLSQLVWEDEIRSQHDPLEGDWKEFARDDTVVDDYVQPEKPKDDNITATEGKDQEGDEQDDTMEDFALPGPTVTMYDVLLDSMAVHGSVAGDPQTFASRKASDILTANFAFDVLHMILNRHRLDGWEEDNDNPHTMPSQISYNAVIRTCANLYYDGENEVLRDMALMGSYAGIQALQGSILEKNSSTYVYMMNVLAKYMPACTSRGNMVHGLFRQCKREGVFSADVRKAYLKANKPSNGPEHDEWIERNLRGKVVRFDAPQRWRRRVKKFRRVPKQTTY